MSQFVYSMLSLNMHNDPLNYFAENSISCLNITCLFLVIAHSFSDLLGEQSSICFKVKVKIQVFQHELWLEITGLAYNLKFALIFWLGYNWFVSVFVLGFWHLTPT